MRLIRRLVLVCLKCNILFKAKHIEGNLNLTADRLSRFQIQEARESASYLDHQPMSIPETLLMI